MKILIDKSAMTENLYTFLRKCGYAPYFDSYTKVLLGSGYPRFHLYVQESDAQYILNLHLDQKRPSYGKETAHSGEYEGDVVEEEARRIRTMR